LSQQLNINDNNDEFKTVSNKERLKRKLLIRRNSRMKKSLLKNNLNKTINQNKNFSKNNENNDNNDNKEEVVLNTKTERNRKNKLRKKMKRLRRREMLKKNNS